MLERLKEQVCQANQDIVKSGLVVLTWGNVSGFDPEQKLVVIKPSGVAYDALTPDAMSVVDLQGNQVSGAYRPSSDTPTHLALYRSWKGIAGVVHTHSRFATMFAQAGLPIPCLGTTHADHFHGDIPVTRWVSQDETASAYEENTGKTIIECIKAVKPSSMPGALVAGHGPFAWGGNAAEALTNAVVLEEVAAMAEGTLRLNPESETLPEYLRDKHFLRKHGPDAYYGQQK